jgi:lipopolysaccharide biosynthesis regulator YciM
MAVGAMVVAPSVARAQVEDELKEGDQAYDREDWRKAAAAYDRAIKKAPQRVSPGAFAKRASIFVILASKAKAEGKQSLYEKILQAGLEFIASKALKAHPGAPEILEQKAIMLWALKSKPDAVKVAEQVVDKKPDAFAVQKILGEFYAVREPEKAMNALEQFFKHRPESIESGDVMPRIHLGFAYLSVAKDKRRTDPKAAEELAEKALEQFEILNKKHRKRAHAEVNANNGLCAAYTFLGDYNRAITVCEKIIQNPRHIDRAGSVFFNLGQSYLQNKQPRKARTVGREYIRLRKSEAKGYILVGDTFAQERNWTDALREYQKAEEYAKNNSEYAADIGIKLGISYRRTDNLPLAIAKLEAALDVDPDNTRLITELGSAYIANGQDDKALGRAEAAIGGKNYQQLAPSQKIDLLVLAGKAAYNLAAPPDPKERKAKPSQAREHFAAAYAIDRKDVKVRIGLVRTINLQAYRAFAKKDQKRAETLLGEAMEVQATAPLTNQNLAVLELERGDCRGALQRLKALSKQRSYALMYHRLSARAYMCGDKPNEARAADHYEQAEKQAGQANLVRAEIYTEWAPLIWDKDLDKAIDMLESAVQYTAQNQELGQPAQRNLALALFRRGWRTMNKGGNKSQAAADFARASRNPKLLKGIELEAFEFSEALAQLDRGNASAASKIFGRLAKKKQEDFLKAPYDKVGAEFFDAYAKYRSGSPAQQRRAASEFNKLQRGAKGAFGAKVQDLIAATYHEMAYDAYRSGKERTAAKYLNTASRAASGAAKREIAHNEAVVKLGSKFSNSALSTFSKLGSSPPEALANKGILLDRKGDPKGAYDAWVAARSKGVRSRQLNDWIAAKKRIFGY